MDPPGPIDTAGARSRGISGVSVVPFQWKGAISAAEDDERESVSDVLGLCCRRLRMMFVLTQAATRAFARGRRDVVL